MGDGVCAAFTDRYGGVSAPPYDELNLGAGTGDDPAAVAENRRRAARALDLDPAKVVWMRQVHSARVAVVDAPFDDTPPALDAVVTTVPRLALAVLVADCAPVLCADPVARVVGVAHAGCEGLAAGVVSALVERMRDLGARPGRIIAAVGPAVCGGCYEVPRDMQEDVARTVPSARCTTARGGPGLDIRGGIRAQLREGGVERVHRDARCTMESSEVYSHRRDGPRTGRIAGYAWLRG